MADELAAANVNRSYQLAASSIAIFTFLLFLPLSQVRQRRRRCGDLPGHADPDGRGYVLVRLFVVLLLRGLAVGPDRRCRAGALRATGDRFWLLGCVLLFLTPSLVLFTIRLLAVASAWFVLWLVYLCFVMRYFPRVQTTGMG